MQKRRVYGGQNPREMPAYGVSEVAHYLQIPPSTLRSWVKGRYYPTEVGPKFFAPLMALPERTTGGPVVRNYYISAL